MTVTANYVDGAFNPSHTDEDLVTITSYDVAGNRVSVLDPNSVATQYQYDQLNRLTAVTENYVLAGPTTAITNVLTVYTYTVAGGLVNIQDGRGKVSSFTYDLLNRQVSAADPLAHTTVYTYNEAGDRIAMLDADGQVINYSFDLLDRQMAIDYPAGTADVAFGYDALSQRTVMTDGTGTTNWVFDAVGRPTTITQPSVGSVGYGYDSLGNRTSLSYPDGKVVTYTYDLAARLTNATDWQAQTTSYSYNTMGQPITVALPNAVTSRYTYDNAGRVAVISHTTLTQTLAIYTYTVDAVGNRTRVLESTLITVTNGSSISHNSIASGALVTTTGTRGSVTALTGGSAILAFTHIRQAPSSVMASVTINDAYDPLYRLTAANYSTGQVYTYTYDAVGNRLSDGGPAGAKVYSYDDANRLTTVNSTTDTWDNNGNLRNDGVFIYSYDAANRLITVTNGITTTGFTYNGLGARAAENDSGVVTTYTLDLAGGLTQVLADGTNTYLYGNGRIAQYAGASAQYFLGDAIGSVRQLADASGAVTMARSYEPYGSVLSSAGTGTTSYGFTGEWTSSPIGLIDLRARQYSPYLNQFIQPDTIVPRFEDPRSLNRYTYAYNSPTNLTDPTGHDPWWCESKPDPLQCYRAYYAGNTSIAPLTTQQWSLAKQQARLFGLPPELVAGTIAVEIEHDTDWYDYYLDTYLQEAPLILHYTAPASFTTVWCYEAADAFLTGYEHYWGLKGGRGPGNGVANVHILTAKNTEAYYAENYPTNSPLQLAPDVYYRMAVLESDEGNIHYTAAILRQLADLRTGLKTSHTGDLNDTDMEVIYSAFRASMFNCYADLTSYRTATASPPECFGSQIRPYLERYRRPDGE